MKVSIATKDEWDDFIEQCPEATFFHSHDWYFLWAQYNGEYCEARIFEFDGEIKVLLPLLIGKALKGLINTYTSSPAGTYGGGLFRKKLKESEKQQLTDYLNKFLVLSLYSNPFDQENNMRLKWDRVSLTQVISLGDDFDETKSKWSKNHRRNLRKGLQENLDIVVATDKKDWKAYYEVYMESLARWGEKALDRYEWSFFELLFKVSIDKCKLWLVKNQGSVISGCLCFYQSQHVVYWHGATSNQGFEKNPVPVLHNHILTEAKKEGYRWYDFNPSGGLEGVFRFKQGFGTQVMEMKIYEKRPRLLSVASNIYQEIIRR